MQYLKKNTQTIRNFIYYYLVGENDGLLLYASNDSSNNVFFFLKKERNKEKNCLSCFALHALFSFRADQRNPERELCRVCLFSLCEQLSASMGWT